MAFSLIAFLGGLVLFGLTVTASSDGSKKKRGGLSTAAPMETTVSRLR